ncbi:DotA/TraY family protein [Azospirillum melinis]|uniref:DotA/TraY family protein n=1 Tax=Azospirillum melinis TaxID=328839 RepID=A0ABX2KHH5_9PROT|nr:DotA/TraY family protein [Azospirillum melinis]MBP2309719.1 conjugal transfer/type IV secretion protein DotA/TraY [Azospirillum melinis]NUB01238.1 DotA/TraY family protein [Azospirillum melinis]
MQMNAQRAKQALGLLVRPTVGRRSVEIAAHQVAVDTKTVARLADSAFEREAADPGFEPVAKADPHILFNAVAQAYETDLNVVERAAQARFTSWFALALIYMMYLIIAPNSWFLLDIPLVAPGQPRWIAALPFLGWLPVITVGTLILARLARASFWLYQVKSRALVPFSAWLQDPAAWLGAPPSALLTALALAGTGAWLLDPGTATAQTPPPGSGSASGSIGTAVTWLQTAIHANDLSMRWLSKLFPDAISVLGSNPASTGSSTVGTDSLRPLFQMFNSVILFIAAAMMSVHTIIGTAATAHEGKVLGGRWNTMWAPIRISLGVASLAPVKGYCMAQLLAVQVLMGGYAFADGLWSIYVANLVAPTSAVVATPSVDLGDRVMAQILTNEVCAKFVVAKKINVESSGLTFWLYKVNPFSEDRPAAAVPIQSKPTADGGALWDYGTLCGAVKLPVSPDAVPPVGEQGMVDYTVVAPAIKAFDAARAQLLGQLISSIRSSGLVENIVSAKMIGSFIAPDLGAMKDQYSKVREAATKYNADLIAAAKTMADALDTKTRAQFIAQSVQLGWASAGAINAALVQLSASAFDHAQSGLPEYHGPDLRRLGNSDKELQGAIDLTQVLIGAMGSAGALENGNAAAAFGMTESGDIVERVFKSPINGLARWVSGRFPLDETNPMATIQSEGQAILIAGEAALLTYGGIRAALATAEKAGENGISNVTAAPQSGFLELARVGSPIIMTIIGGMLILGTVEAYIVPMIPFVSWFFAIIGCASFAVEFVIAAPLAAFMHVRMDGDELIGPQQKPFYSMLLGGAMRPTLLLFGLFLSTMVFSVMAGFLNSTFGLAMSSAQGNHITGVAGILGLMCLLMYLHYQLAMRTMELVHRVPAMVSRLTGVDDLDQDTHRNSTSIAGAVVGMVQRGGAHVTNAAFTAGGPGGNGDGRDGGGKPNRRGGGEGGDPSTPAASVSGASKLAEGSFAAADKRPSANAEGGTSSAGDGSSIAEVESTNTDRDR